MGCQTQLPWQAPMTDKVHLSGADQFSERLDKLDLVDLVHPGADKDETLGQAFQAFYAAGLSPDAFKQKRNQIQETILAASNQRCAVYKNYIQTQASNYNFGIGSLATAAGGAGAIVTGANAARALAGVAGIFSGIRAEYNQDYFSNLATHVLADGIDLRRHQIYDQIARDGQSKGIEVYSLEAAIKDALYYHGECSAMAGFSQASNSIKTTEDPGLDAATRVLVKANIMRKVLDNQAIDLGTITNGKVVSNAGLLVAGTPLPDGTPAAASTAMARAVAALTSLASSAKTAIDGYKDKLDDVTALRDAVDVAQGMAMKELTETCQAPATKSDAVVVAANDAAGKSVPVDPVAAAKLAVARAQAAVLAEQIHQVEVAYGASLTLTAKAVADGVAGLPTDKKLAKTVTDPLAAALKAKTYPSGCK
jgi:hypothetical protein